MPTRKTIGTCYFVSFRLACRYYADYEPGISRSELEAVVQRKIDEGQIHIGLPPIKVGQIISRIDNGTRYALSEYDD